MLCRAIPYEGQEPYIFLSYCHKDAAVVYPMLEQMVRDGFRVWYDDGNRPGDDWLENIAQHLDRAAVCLAMVSQKSSESHNCKNELSFAMERRKKLMVVMLEDFPMSLGMRMQLTRIHHLKKWEYPSQLTLLQKLYDTEEMKACKAAPGSLPMREITEEKVPEEKEVTVGIRRFVQTEEKVGKMDAVPEDTDRKAKEEAEKKAAEEAARKAKEEAEKKAAEEAARKAREEAERKAAEEAARKAKEEAERKAAEEAARKAKEEAEQKAAEEAARKAAEAQQAIEEARLIEEAAQKAVEEARRAAEEAIRRAEAMVREAEEKARKIKEEAEKKAAEEAARKAREEAERKAAEEAARKAREEAERKAAEEAARKAKEEAEKKAAEEAARKAREEAERKAAEEAARKAKEEAERKAKEEWDDDDGEKTIREDPLKKFLDDDDGEKTIREDLWRPMRAVILRPATGEGFAINAIQTRMGRSQKNCEIHLTGNQSISNTHAEIIQSKTGCYLRDLDSSNGTYVEDRRLEKDEQVKLEEVSAFRLYDELFLFISGARAKQVFSAGAAGFLRSVATGNVQLLESETMPLDRKHPWADGTLNDLRISRKHAQIHWDGDLLKLEDLDSANGTYVNERKLEPGVPAHLQNGDKIRLGDTTLEVGIVKL